MNVKLIFFATHPFIDAYIQSDFLGKLIFLALGLLSIISWILLIYKIWLTQKMCSLSTDFRQQFLKSKDKIFEMETTPPEQHNPFSSIYSVLKRYSIDLLDKNRQFGKSNAEIYLSPSDLDFVGAHLYN